MSIATQMFSIEQKLRALVTVQKIDSKLDELRFIKGQLPEEVSELQDQLIGLQARKTKVEEEINGIKEYVENAKNKIEEAEELIKKYEKQSKNVRNNREFTAINNEIEMQQVEIKILERKIKVAGEDFDKKVEQIATINEEISGKEIILDQKQKDLDKVIASTEQEEKKYAALSETEKRKLDERLSFTYEKIRKTYRNGLAVAEVERDACGGCFQLVPPQKQMEIVLKKRLILCENCGRILVDKETIEAVQL